MCYQFLVRPHVVCSGSPLLARVSFCAVRLVQFVPTRVPLPLPFLLFLKVLVLVHGNPFSLVAGACSFLFLFVDGDVSLSFH